MELIGDIYRWVRNNRISILVTSFLIPFLFFIIKYFWNNYFFSEAKKDEKKKIKNLFYELMGNLGVAKGRKAWATYSLNNRNIVEELRKIIGEELCQKISEFYLTAETTNMIIKNVGPGWWSNDKLESCYAKFIEPLEQIIASLQKLKKFKNI